MGSWVRDSSLSNNQTLLAHEQLHFDIAELFARKIRYRIAQCMRSGCNAWAPELSKEIKCLLQEREELNAAFDQEAWADPSLPPVYKWQAVVQHELTLLAPYKSKAATGELHGCTGNGNGNGNGK
ncbi:hypothetical protein GCM10022409_19880 [Hymenobacter glaciei]|uniref:DUF922 domain-containing protein n=2 Tax=Hymenobacter glaciei TaxID=877209 RepID=A0ABP7U3I9_9BACT